jgi:very-short-patch-repair endonuclease
MPRVTTLRRRQTDADGQLDNEFRRRDQSGIQHDRLAELSALLADIGPPCWASHDTSSAAHIFDGYVLVPPYHILLPRGRNVRRIGHVIHTTDSFSNIDLETRWGLPVVSPSRSLIQISATAGARSLTAALDGALRDRLTTEDFLHRRIAALRTSGRYGIPALLAVMEGSEITRGGQSWLEREFLKLVDQAGLPLLQTQVHLGHLGDRFIRVDFRFAGTPIVVETLGYRWHRTGAQMRMDSDRLNRLQMEGFVVLQFTYEQVVSEAQAVVALLLEALEPFVAGLARSA